MNRSIFKTALVSAFLLLFGNGAFAWTVVKNFNSGSVGSVAQGGSDAFSGAAGGALYDDSRAYEGSKSAKLHVKGGTEGFGYWGGIVNFPQNVYRGEKVWLEMYIYVPSSFEVSTPGNGSLKFLRFKSSRSDGSHSGYVDMQIIDDGSSSSEEFRMLREGQAVWYYYGQNGVLSRDRWHRVNVELGVDNTPVSQGGSSYAKFWLNGYLLTTEKDIKAIMSGTDYMTSFYLFTYWNGTAPKDQHLWVDNIQISNQRPAWADELGSVPFNPPSAPTGLAVSQVN